MWGEGASLLWGLKPAAFAVGPGKAPTGVANVAQNAGVAGFHGGEMGFSPGDRPEIK